MARDGPFLLLLACFLLSGLAGLIYETVWTEQLALVFGTSELAVATVLGAYMGGLAVGAAVARRYVNRLHRPIRVYAALELGIALSALAVPAALALAGRLQILLLGGLDVPPEAGSLSSALFYLAAAFAILLVPTGLMGATLPLLARHAVRRDRDLGSRVGLLYTANTLGAAAGVLVAAFVLLPRMGLGATVLVAVAVNVAVFLIATLLARTAGASAVVEEPSEVEEARGSGWILPLVLVSGFVSFSWEVLWTRLLSHLLGGSVYAFGTMLAAFLAGIALGAAVASRLAREAARAWRGFAVAQIGVAACSLAAFAAVDRLPEIVEGLAAGGASLARDASLAALTLFPGALCVGATFPFAVRILAGGASQAGPASARVYAWSTVGAITGALGTGFVVLPELAFAGTATLAVAISLVLALAAALLARPRSPGLAVFAVAGLVVLALAPPRTPWRVLRTTPLSGRSASGDVAYYGVGRSATVLLVDENDTWRLTTNGLPEAAIQPPGARVGSFTVARWMALLPLVSRPEAESLAIIGLGAGLTLGSVPAAFDEIHVVELEPEVIRANRKVAGERRRDPLADPRLQLHVNDARSALTLSPRRFDAIVSQPSHPWTSGSSHLFTREFFSLVRQRLEPRGVFVQWIGLRFVDGDLLRTLVATLADVFSEVEVYQPYPGGGVLFLCGDQPLMRVADAARGLAASREGWRRMGIFTADDVLVERVLTATGSRRFAAGAPLNTDSRNLLKMRAPRILDAPLGARGLRLLLAEHDPLAALPAAADGIATVRRLLRRGSPERARRVASGLQDPAQRQVALALTDLAGGRPRLGEKALWQTLAAAADGGEVETAAGAEAFYALLLRRRRDLAEGRVPEPLAALVDADPRASALVEGWRRLRLGDASAVRRLDPRLAEIDSRHALFGAATALRIAWRQSLGEGALARQALALIDPALAHGAGVSGLLRRARLAILAGEREVALASLVELAELLRRNPSAGSRGRDALAFLEAMPATWKDARHTRLVERLASPASRSDG